jgi:hypothetical protein
MATVGLIFKPAKEASMAAKKTAKREAVEKRPEGFVSWRRISAKTMATLALKRGNEFAAAVMSFLSAEARAQSKATQAEPRTQH